MHIFRNIKWLFTKTLPDNYASREVMFCDYCGNSSGVTNYAETDFKVCQTYLKRVLDTNIPSK